jgi:excinuclease ABC subunit B
MAEFFLESEFAPAGDQPRAIQELCDGVAQGRRRQCLLGVTGSGKTFAIANVIARTGLPALVLAPNKTLAAQLYSEFKQFFPKNAVEYFVSYYDYYQPEAYIPSTDTYIAKDTLINEEIDRMRHAATRSLLERNDVVIVASVSCIYGLGSPEAYYDMLVHLAQGSQVDRDKVLRKLVEIQYTRNDYDFHRGTFRVRGDVVEVFPAHEESEAVRIEWFGDEVERISEIDPIRGRTLRELEKVAIYPASHYVTTADRLARAVSTIQEELAERLQFFKAENKLVEAQRLEQRTLYDIETLETTGSCPGIENYSRHFTGQVPGTPPPTLLDYFPKGYLLFIDESHVTVPQVGGMYRGDRARKLNLVEHGFRLPCALDNRPLKFDEFDARTDNVVYVSATPGDYEVEQCQGVVTEMIVRPTGLLDPEIEVRPATHQVDDLLAECHKTIAAGFRVLITTLTKRLAEDLTEYYRELGIKVRYLHSDIDTLERVQIISELRQGKYDVLVGINLLREGLDLPEVALVAVLDADKEGFLRSGRSLIQTIGRAARNSLGRVILYADRTTDSMRHALDETSRRRERQHAHNLAHGIVPKSVHRAATWIETLVEQAAEALPAGANSSSRADLERAIAAIRKEMLAAADALDFERAADLRDRMLALERAALELTSAA